MESLLRTATVNSFAVIYTSLTKNSIYVKGLSPLFLITNKLHEISRLNFKFGDDVSIESLRILTPHIKVPNNFPSILMSGILFALSMNSEMFLSTELK